MKRAFFYCLFFSIALITLQCTPDDTNSVPPSLRIHDFVWKGLNLYYLWQENVPDLQDDRFANQNELNTFLSEFDSPEALFNALKTDALTDRFSVIYSDYTVLQGILTGNNDNNGMDYGLRYKNGSQTDLYGWVRYVLPGSDAAQKNIQRGAIFYAVNQTPLTVSNYRNLLAQNSYSIQLANYDNGNITPNGISINLTKTPFSENPIYTTTVINTGSHKIGYLMYNGFYRAYESELNTVITNLKNEGITDLVLDLRYNSGGSIDTATRLASMITGQFSNQIFAREQWNAKLQAYYEATQPENLLNRFTTTTSNGENITNLNLNRVFILTTKSTASASELLINGLKPYITVIQIGEATSGKNVGSITLYDSPTFGIEDINSTHRYAMQPIVLRIANKEGFGEYTQGLNADYSFTEDYGNLGTLGNSNEPMLTAAINIITGNGRYRPRFSQLVHDHFSDTRVLQGENQMYKDLKKSFKTTR